MDSWKIASIVAHISLAFALAFRVDAAVEYRFSSIVQGSYPRTVTGTAIVDGKQWRVDYDTVPDSVSDMTAVLGADDRSIIVLNDQTHTWFRLPSRSRLSAGSSLFSFGRDVRVSKLKVSSTSHGPGVTISFSYRIDADAGSETVRGDVWGEIRIRSSRQPSSVDLPWKPADLATGLDVVDAAVKTALMKVEGTISQCEIEVSRRLEGGVILKQVTQRVISDIAPTNVDAQRFSVPSGYRYQEPVIGAPAGH